MWQISESDVESIAIGAGILGAGGGGNPYLGQVHITRLLRQGCTANVMDLEDVADDANVAVVGVMGAPTVGVEKLPRGDEAPRAIAALEKFTGRPIDALVCAEIGGANSIAPLIGSALSGKPVLDGDAMGRAFPETQMSTHFINGVSCTPAVMVDEKGNCIIFSHVTSPRELERFARHLCVTMGCVSMLVLPMMTGYQARTTSVPHTISLVKRLGDAVLNARRSKQPIVPAILAVTGGGVLFNGKLIDVQRRTTGGFARGQARIEGFDAFGGEQLRIEFQNENLIAWRGSANGDPAIVATVPDLICIVDSESGEPVTTEQLRYGLRVTVLGIPCSDRLRTPQALPVVNPAAFGYLDIQYTPITKIPGQGIE